MKNYFSINSIGFTLIELLVVVFIIGIVSSVIFITNYNPHNFNETKSFTEQLQSKMQLTHKQAVLQMKTIGLKISSNHYEFFQLFESQKQQWISLNNTDDFWKKNKIPPHIKLNINLLKANKSTNGPQIIFFPNGEMTEFTLIIYTKGTKRRLQLIGYHDGNIHLEERK